MAERIRLFISVEMPEEVKARIARELFFLKDSGADVKWVAPEKFHLTLKFLGYVDGERVEEIAGVLSRTAEDAKPFDVEFYGTGAFPSTKNPRVVWVGVKDPSAGLHDLALRIEDALSVAGFEREDKPYSAHLTLGRLKSRRNLDGLLARLATLREASFGKINVADIYVMKSDLKPTGSVYTALRAIGLGKRQIQNTTGETTR